MIGIQGTDISCRNCTCGHYRIDSSLKHTIKSAVSCSCGVCAKKGRPLVRTTWRQLQGHQDSDGIVYCHRDSESLSSKSLSSTKSMGRPSVSSTNCPLKRKTSCLEIFHKNMSLHPFIVRAIESFQFLSEKSDIKRSNTGNSRVC